MKGNNSVGEDILNLILDTVFVRSVPQSLGTPEVFRALKLRKVIVNQHKEEHLMTSNDFPDSAEVYNTFDIKSIHGMLPSTIMKSTDQDKSKSTVEELMELQAEDIFSDLILSNEVPLQCIPKTTDAVTQTSQTLLPGLMDASTQSSQGLLDEKEMCHDINSIKKRPVQIEKNSHYEEQVVPEIQLNRVPITSHSKFRRIGLSKRVRLTPLHAVRR